MQQFRFIFTVAFLISTVNGAPGGTSTAYQADFEQPVDKEWSNRKIELAPEGSRHFLGAFTTEKLTLRLEQLKRHDFVRVTFDLYVLATWDGNAVESARGAKIGPDGFKMGIEGGVEIINATFSNMSEENTFVVDAAKTQSFPGLFASDSVPARTGAFETETLGVEWIFGDRITRKVDSVYRLTYLLPHDAKEIVFYFQGAGNLQPADDECWGLDHVKVELLDKADIRAADEKTIAGWWEAIGGGDAVVEYRAFWNLAAGGDDVVNYLKKHVKKSAVDRNAFDKLLIGLSSEEFQTRESAGEAIAKMGTAALALAKEARDDTASEEVRTRLDEILANLAKMPMTDKQERRFHCAMRLLGIINTPAAVKLKQELMGS